MTALLHRLKRTRALSTCCAMLLAALVAAAPARAEEPVNGTVTVNTDNGYARLAFKFDEPVPAQIQLAWPVLVIHFKKPVAVAVDRLAANAPDYINAARSDPDGGAIRIALTRKLKINATPAAERLFVDLLPEKWTGVMPELPKAVVEELAQRAREAERLLRRQHADEQHRPPPLIRVKVASEPTFTRFVFELPDTVTVVPGQGKGTFKLSFDRAIKWDLGDALAAMPPTLRTIKTESKDEASTVSFVLKGAPGVRSFREGQSFAVDIDRDGAAAKSVAKIPAPPVAPVLAITPPATVPATDRAAADRPVANAGLPPLIDMPAPAAAKSAAKSAGKSVPAAKPAPAAAAQSAPAANPKPAPVLSATPSQVKAAPSPPVETKNVVPPPNPEAPVVVGLHQGPDLLRLEFPFAEPTPAAAFTRADMLWLVFDTPARVDLTALNTRGGEAIRSAVLARGAEGEAIVRIQLKRPQLISLESDGPAWTVDIGDMVAAPPHPLGIARSVVGRNRANIVIPFEHAASVHVISDPGAGDRLIVVTALGPARGFLRPRDYVELTLLASAQGVAVQPIADDVAAALTPDKITLGRPGGLSLSTARLGGDDVAGNPHNMPFDPQIWGFDRKTDFQQRQSELIRAAAGAPPEQRLQARLNLARFYLAGGMFAEAKGVLDVALADQNGVADVTGSVLDAVADVMLRRPEAALKELNQPQVGNRFDAPVWRAIAYEREGKWVEARAGFKNVENAVAALPIELQRMAMMAALRTALAVRDYNTASRLTDEFDTMGVPTAMAPEYEVLVGRLDEALGHTADALTHYRSAAASADRPAAAQARLHEIELRFARGELPREQTIAALETLTTVWRGDATEAEGLKLLAHLYTEAGRYREAFHVMRTALLAHPNSELTRQIEDEAAATFDNLFLSGKGDALPPLDALALFYDYRQLTPIGPRGDEMIRRLANRLVAVDLLDQAAELLEHQVDHRLQGAARAQVATRLALIYLMNHKPARALATLRSTRTAGLAGELRDQRLLLEARSLSDVGQRDLALELIANIQGQPAMRLRADILWAAKRWREAAEQIEKLYGDRWKQFAPLSASERSDILRAAVGYALADETISLTRLRDRYMPKMAQGPDRRAFEVVSAPIGTANDAFQNVARRVTSISTLDAFLRDLRAAYPDKPSVAAKAAAPPRPAKPQAVPAAASTKPAAAPAKPDARPTGSIAPQAAD